MKNLFGQEYDHTDPNGSMLVCEVHERNLIEKVSGLGDSGGTFIDIGANVGLWSLSLCDEYAGVIAFEPNPVACASLLKNCILYGDKKVQVIPLAAWDKEGEVELTCFGNTGHTTAKPGWKPGLEELTGASTGKIKVKAVPVDRLTHLIKNRVSFIKIDTEGSELEAIRGMSEMLERDRPMLLIEIHRSGDEQKIVEAIPGRSWEVMAYGGSQYLFSKAGE